MVETLNTVQYTAGLEKDNPLDVEIACASRFAEEQAQLEEVPTAAQVNYHDRKQSVMSGHPAGQLQWLSVWVLPLEFQDHDDESGNSTTFSSGKVEFTQPQP